MENKTATNEKAIAELKSEYCKLSTSPKRMREIMQDMIRLRCEIVNNAKVAA